MIPEKCLENHIAILGKTGSGKTSTAKLAVEQVVAAGARVCILDPVKSDWWGLISSADGKRPGLAFEILGGPHGHVPLHSSAGAAIGALVGNGTLPLSIVDMADFEPGGLQRFFCDFAPALLKKMRGVVYLVIEESHEFAPKERSGIGAENMAIHWAKKLATAGRSKGIRLILATQRTQSLHNAMLGSCETMIAHRMTAPADQAPIIQWLKANVDKTTTEAVSGSLSSLKTGEGWICSGEAGIFERVKFPRIATFDNSATPTGDDDTLNISAAAVDRERLRSLVGEAVAEAEANDPKKLKARIAALEKQLASKAPAAAVADDAALKAARDGGYDEGISDGEKIGWNSANLKFRETLANRLPKIREALADVQHRLDEIAVFELPSAEIDPLRQAAQRPVAKQASPGPTQRPAEKRAPAAPVAISGKEPLLDAARAVWPAKLTWGQLASTIGRKARGGHFNSTRKRLIDTGAVVEESGLVVLTDPPSNGSASPADMLEQNLPQPAQKMFSVIRGEPGLTIPDLADRLGMQPRGGHWNTGMAVLRRNNLIVDEGGRLLIAEGLE